MPYDLIRRFRDTAQNSKKVVPILHDIALMTRAVAAESEAAKVGILCFTSKRFLFSSFLRFEAHAHVLTITHDSKRGFRLFGR
jgi:hypothetical protein